MNKKFFKRGFSPILGLVVVFVLALGVVGAVLVSQKGTGFVNFAAKTESVWIGSIGETVCVLENPKICYKLFENNLEGTGHYITSPNQNLKNFVAKNVIVHGIEKSKDGKKYIIASTVRVTSRNTLEDEKATLVETDLGLVVIPTLNQEMGKVDLQFIWKNKSQYNQPNELSSMKSIGVVVNREGGGDSNTVQRSAVQSLDSTSAKMIGVPVEGNASYQAVIRVSYANNLGVVTKIKTQKVAFGYFEDMFSSNRNIDLNTDKDWSCGGAGGVVSNGSFKIHTPLGGATLCKLKFIGKKLNHFASHVELKSLNYKKTPTSDQNYAFYYDLEQFGKPNIRFEFLWGNNYPSTKGVVGYFDYKSKSYDILGGSADIVLPMLMDVVNDGRLKFYYDGNVVNLPYEVIGPFGDNSVGSSPFQIVFRGFDVDDYVEVDNFRLVWVK